MDLMSNKTFLTALDWFFLGFHSVFTLFNVFGWIPRKTRKLHLVTILLTAGSWFILGIWYGLGFCFCTEWHWQVRDALGKPVESYSYIHFLIREVAGINLPPGNVDTAVMGIFLFCAAMSFYLNYQDYRKKRRGDN